MEMKKRLIIVGKGGSGKDHMRKMLQDEGFRYCISHTTRPPRKDETNGVDYFFISLDKVYNAHKATSDTYSFSILN